MSVSFSLNNNSKTDFISEMPDEVILNIMKYLDGQSLASLQSVNSRMYSLGQGDCSSQERILREVVARLPRNLELFCAYFQRELSNSNSLLTEERYAEIFDPLMRSVFQGDGFLEGLSGAEILSGINQFTYALRHVPPSKVIRGEQIAQFCHYLTSVFKQEDPYFIYIILEQFHSFAPVEVTAVIENFLQQEAERRLSFRASEFILEKDQREIEVLEITIDPRIWFGPYTQLGIPQILEKAIVSRILKIQRENPNKLMSVKFIDQAEAQFYRDVGLNIVRCLVQSEIFVTGGFCLSEENIDSLDVYRDFFSLWACLSEDQLISFMDGGDFQLSSLGIDLDAFCSYFIRSLHKVTPLTTDEEIARLFDPLIDALFPDTPMEGTASDELLSAMNQLIYALKNTTPQKRPNGEQIAQFCSYVASRLSDCNPGVIQRLLEMFTPFSCETQDLSTFLGCFG